MRGIRTIISPIFRYREIASWTKFGGVLLQHEEEKSAISLTVLNIYTVGQNQNFNTDKNLPPQTCKILQSEKLILHRESPLLKNRSLLKSDLKNLKRVGTPYFRPNLSFKGIISTTFS
jgi:hypothetical protein